MRLRYVFRFANQGSFPHPESPWDVYDCEAPGVEPGEMVFFTACPNRATAVMTCMALNGSTNDVHPADE